MTRRIVIIGAGQAGLQAAASARQDGFDGEIVLFGGETEPPYQRPPLSKAYLKGELNRERLYLKPAAFFEQARIDLRLGTRIAKIDRSAGCVLDDAGQATAYDQLILTTGAPPRRLACPGADARGVQYLRSLADSDHLRNALSVDGPVVIVGAGYIGLEVAAVARAAGKDVTVVEIAERPLQRVAGPAMADFVARRHLAAGVRFRFGTGLAGIEVAAGRAVGAHLNDSETLPCRTVLVGIGAMPELALAEAAGLTCANGLVVDETARTHDRNIWAAGDVANFPSPLYGRRMRLESVPNAIEQGKVAGINAARAAGTAGRATDEPLIHDALPWFWSDQYDMKLQTAGVRPGPAEADPADRDVLRVGADGASLSVWTLRGDIVQSVEAANDPAAFIVGKRLIPLRRPVRSDALADPSQDLKSLL